MRFSKVNKSIRHDTKTSPTGFCQYGWAGALIGALAC